MSQDIKYLDIKTLGYMEYMKVIHAEGQLCMTKYVCKFRDTHNNKVSRLQIKFHESTNKIS